VIVSWNWLKDYVVLDVEPQELARRLMMAGLNHESTTTIDDDLAIDLEVTSNRPDCLGHLGIAREAAVLYGQQLRLPPVAPRESQPAAAELTKVAIECPELCPRYIARVIRGVRIGPSPDWLVDRLRTLGISPINNAVDITNYVLMECGQPLHVFDLSKLAGRQIIVREARQGERIEAIDHKTYELAPGMCVIADERNPVAVGGVMGGAASEVSTATTEILLEAAQFDPAAVRATARRLSLHSDSSYRFERGVDPEGADWASRRAAQLIQELAGGYEQVQVAAGSVDVGRGLTAREPVVLRFDQLRRILGIEIEPAEVCRILRALGNTERSVVLPARVEYRGSSQVGQIADAGSVEVVPPSWRADLTREIDLIEEVARIHGYDAIPEDVSVPMATSARSVEDWVLAEVRHVLTAAGFDEALTVSVVEEAWSAAFSPWTESPPLVASMPVLRRADRLRRSLVPSLLGARRTNETLSNPVIELFETARVYLPRAGQLPDEPLMLALASGGDFLHVKGVVEALVAALKCPDRVEAQPAEFELLARGHGARLLLAGEVLGYLGPLSAEGMKTFELREPATVAELRLDLLIKFAVRVPRYEPLPVYPAVSRDLNLQLDANVAWSGLERVVRTAAGPLLERLEYRDTYRDPQRVPPGKKRVLFSFALRDPQGTLTGAQADELRDRVAAACAEQLGAEMPSV
jgi:phenylalanyl-tRNA synthetase beta chain